MLYIQLLIILFHFCTDDYRQEFVQKVNEIRKQGCNCGGTYYSPVGPVTWDTQLEKIALLHSKDMATKNYFNHISKSGKNPGDRLKANGYQYYSFAENLFYAKGYTPSIDDVVNAWKNSPTHCKNLMNDSVKEMGIGIYQGYYTQLFGTRQTK